MKNDQHDENFDRLMRGLMKDASLDDDSVNEIADSPAIWWGVQRRIAEQKVATSPWPPVGNWMRWLAIGVPGLAALAIAVALFINRPATHDAPVASSAPPVAAAPAPASVQNLPASQHSPTVEKDQPAVHSVAKARFVQPKRSAMKNLLTATVAKQPQEVKTDFISLSYARNAESGQIVRVKVPSSMMVSTGLVASVKRPSELVDAEIIVGDDGLTRAIRFIHKQ